MARACVSSVRTFERFASCSPASYKIKSLRPFACDMTKWGGFIMQQLWVWSWCCCSWARYSFPPSIEPTASAGCKYLLINNLFCLVPHKYFTIEFFHAHCLIELFHINLFKEKMYVWGRMRCACFPPLTNMDIGCSVCSSPAFVEVLSVLYNARCVFTSLQTSLNRTLSARTAFNIGHPVPVSNVRNKGKGYKSPDALEPPS